ncbi:MAG: molecular chaperone HtpG [Planctomycetota bacterium]
MAEYAFQTEVQQLLHLMIHSLYSEREIFLRELVSNASDACDKLRFESLTDKELTGADERLQVRLIPDQEARTLTIEDTGIGLTQDEAVSQLGTIAKSGTREFVEAVSAKDQGTDELAGLIGQFGVGFYSAFMVSDKIVVESRSARASSDAGVRWESTGDGSFTTEVIPRPQRGTAITLHLKDDAEEFLDRWRLRSLIKKYSDYVTYPVELPKEKGEDDTDDVACEFEQINEGKALWTRPRDEITAEQYKEFYQGACKQWDDPATHLHFGVEGTLAFTALLFVPSQRPMDLFDQQHRGLSLYVRRVFIMDDCRELLPEYLRFVRGVVDSDDLPLNVSRQMLQQEDVVRRLRKSLVKKILDHLDRLARSDESEEQEVFALIERNFGPILREGLVNDFDNRERLLKLVRLRSTWTLEQEGGDDDTAPLKTSFAEYIERMGEDQDAIYYLTAPGIAAARTAPQLEGFKRKGWEVLFLIDPVDEWVVTHLHEVMDKPFTSVSKGAVDLGGEEDKQELEQLSEEHKGFLEACAGHLDDVGEVRLTRRLTDSPCCLVLPEHAMSEAMTEMMRRMGQPVPEVKRILELNPDHELVRKLRGIYEADAGDERLPHHLRLLRDQAVLAEGGRIEDPAGFARAVQEMLGATI